jgi:hypothetical protein
VSSRSGGSFAGGKFSDRADTSSGAGTRPPPDESAQDFRETPGTNIGYWGTHGGMLPGHLALPRREFLPSAPPTLLKQMSCREEQPGTAPARSGLFQPSRGRARPRRGLKILRSGCRGFLFLPARLPGLWRRRPRKCPPLALRPAVCPAGRPLRKRDGGVKRAAGMN